MTQIDFYILTDNAANAGDRFTCKLVDKVYHLNHTVYIQTQTELQAKQLDDLLWTFIPGSFLPHELNAQHEVTQVPILIGYSEQSTTFHEVLINLNQEVPVFFSQFDRVAEIVYGDENMRNQARKRYKFYRDRGYSLNTYDINIG